MHFPEFPISQANFAPEVLSNIRIGILLMLDNILKIDVLVHLLDLLLDPDNESIHEPRQMETELLLRIHFLEVLVEIYFELETEVVHHQEDVVHRLGVFSLEVHLFASGLAFAAVLEFTADVDCLEVLLQSHFAFAFTHY